MGLEQQVRQAAMAWLDNRPTEAVDFAFASNFEFHGERLPLMDVRRGIRKPASLTAALAIRTTYTPPGRKPPYEDAIGTDGLQRYKWQGDDPNHSDNVALRRAKDLQLPLIWFIGVDRGLYEPLYPVWVLWEEPEHRQFALAVEPSQRLITPTTPLDADDREYLEVRTKARLHQRIFRTRVLLAYLERCAVCNLGHTQLLDAAHIIPDGRPNGQPVVPNGLAMCKIHHSAFDANILGLRPDLTVHIRDDILEEVDGPMLEHGLKARHNEKLLRVPSAKLARPDIHRLEERYAEFLAAG